MLCARALGIPILTAPSASASANRYTCTRDTRLHWNTAYWLVNELLWVETIWNISELQRLYKSLDILACILQIFSTNNHHASVLDSQKPRRSHSVQCGRLSRLLAPPPPDRSGAAEIEEEQHLPAWHLTPGQTTAPPPEPDTADSASSG